jgi:hypothetical protein
MRRTDHGDADEIQREEGATTCGQRAAGVAGQPLELRHSPRTSQGERLPRASEHGGGAQAEGERQDHPSEPPSNVFQLAEAAAAGLAAR